MSGAGLQAQRNAILRECERRGWELLDVIEDAGFSASDLKRPGVQVALEMLADGEASALVVAKLDRLSRSMLDFSTVMTAAQRQGWGLIALDLNVDTTTPSGEAMANVLATFAQFERRLIQQRTREALAIKKAEGVRLGRPRAVDEQTARWIVDKRNAGETLRGIAEDLNRRKVPTAQGGKRWHASTVRAVLSYSATNT